MKKKVSESATQELGLKVQFLKMQVLESLTLVPWLVEKLARIMEYINK